MPLFLKPLHTERILRNTDDDTSRDRALAEQGIERIPTRELPRMQAMAAIKPKRDGLEDVDAQLAAQGVDDPTRGAATPPPPPPPPLPTAEPRRDDLTATAPPPPPVATPAPPAGKTTGAEDLLAQLGGEPLPLEALDKLTVKVAGKVITVAEARRTMQLDGAAFARLEEATRLLNEAKGLQATGAPAVSPPAGDDTSKQAKETPPRDETVTALVTALFAGDTEAATAAMGNLLSPQQARVDPAAIAQQVKQQLSTEDALEEFKGSYSDIASDPFLASVADNFFAQAKAADPQKSFSALLAEAGNATRDWVRSKAGVSTTERSGEDTSGKKLKKDKTQIDNVGGVGGRNATPEPRILTASEKIEAMRKQRGLES
jgi:hypothetical protein